MRSGESTLFCNDFAYANQHVLESIERRPVIGRGSQSMRVCEVVQSPKRSWLADSLSSSRNQHYIWYIDSIGRLDELYFAVCMAGRKALQA